MKQLFSLQSFGGRRFFSLILFLVNLQIIQAVCRHDDVPPSDASSLPALFISEGTVISGMEKVNISHPIKEKERKKPKRKAVSKSNEKKKKKKENLSQPAKKSNRDLPIFSMDNQSEKSLLSVSDNDKQIVRPNQTTKFLLLGAENKIPALIYLPDIFLKKKHNGQWSSNPNFFRNFNRPPPSV